MIKLCYYLSLLTCFSLSKLAAQNSNLFIDAINNTQFIVLVNGDQQNFIPGARVVLTNLPESVYKVKLINPITREIYTEEDIKLPASVNLIYALQKDENNTYKLAFTSSKTTNTYNSLKIDDEKCYTENSKILIHGPYAPLPKTRNFIVQWGSEKVQTIEKQVEYPIEINVTIYVCENSYLNAVCPTSVSEASFNELHVALSNNKDELEKLSITKQIIINLQRNNSCFTSAQAKNLLQIFDTDKSKMAIAKLIIELLADPPNQILLRDAFDNPELFNSIN